MSLIPDGDELIVLSDVFGGSVNNELMKYLSKKNYYLIAGMNLPLVMSLATTMDMNTEEQIDLAVNGMKQVIYCNEMAENMCQSSTDEMNEGI